MSDVTLEFGRPLRIVLVSTGAPPDPFGGIGTYIEGLLSELPEPGDDVHLVGATRHADLPRTYPFAGATVRRVLVARAGAGHELPSGLLGLALAAVRLNLTAAWYTWRLHSTAPVDVVAVHDWMCAPAGLACSVLLRIPLCYHLHSTEILRRAGRPSAQAILGRFLHGLLARAARLVVIPTPGTLGPGSAGADRLPLAVIPHGPGKAWRTDLPDSTQRLVIRRRIRADYGIPDGRSLLLFAGRYAAIKGVDELVTAVGILVADGLDVALVLAGTGWPERAVDEQLRARVTAAGLQDRVHVLGHYLDSAALRDHVVAADVCTFPSTYESFGFAALEAMALEARVVVGPGFDEGVVDSVGGACLRTRTVDPAELAAVIAHAVGPGGGSLGERARAHVLGRHSWATSAARTRTAYRRLRDPTPRPI